MLSQPAQQVESQLVPSLMPDSYPVDGRREATPILTHTDSHALTHTHALVTRKEKGKPGRPLCNVCVLLHVVCVPRAFIPAALGGQEGINPLEWKLQRLVSCHVALGSEQRSSTSTPLTTEPFLAPPFHFYSLNCCILRIHIFHQHLVKKKTTTCQTPWY